MNKLVFTIVLLLIVPILACQTEPKVESDAQKFCQQFATDLRASGEAKKVLQIQHRGLEGDRKTLWFCMQTYGVPTSDPMAVTFDKAQEALFWSLHKTDENSAPPAAAKQALTTMTEVVEGILTP